MRGMSSNVLTSLAIIGCITVSLPSCVETQDSDEISHETQQSTSSSDAIDRGRDVWFKNSYGGEKFFTFLANHPDPAKRIKIGFEAVLNTPRSVRHDIWGVVNDPDCTANPMGGMDICPDPEATGVVGMRQTSARGFQEFGAACAACHAGMDPNNPPADANNPSWDNIHATIGNQKLQLGMIFAANLDLSNPADAVRAMVFASWPAGTVDTTALFSDNINNPGTITAFWEHNHRNVFDVEGFDEPKLRNGQGGEDDIGGDIAALRVYTNIGVCFFECVAGPATVGVPISIDACRNTCPDFPPQSDLDDMGEFLASHSAPQFPGWPVRFIKYVKGAITFKRNCASCHDNKGRDLRRVLSNDEVNTLTDLGANATNKCRALGTNWDPGNIWAEFTSSTTHQRAIDGTKGYRSMPLAGVWSTPPFMHNNSIGTGAPATATLAEKLAAYESSMYELLSATRTPVINTIPVDVGPFPAGTPLAYVVNRDPGTGALLCDDVVENGGHHFGSELSDRRKSDLIYYLRFK